MTSFNLPLSAEVRALTAKQCLGFGTLCLAGSLLFAVAAHAADLTSRGWILIALAVAGLCSIFAWFRGRTSAWYGALTACAALSVGGALAAYAQTYPSDADSPEFFALWAALITLWAWTGRPSLVRLIWAALADTAAVLFAIELIGTGEYPDLLNLLALWHLGLAALAQAFGQTSLRSSAVLAAVVSAAFILWTGTALAAFSLQTVFAAALLAVLFWHDRYVILNLFTLTITLGAFCTAGVIAVYQLAEGSGEAAALCLAGASAFAFFVPAVSALTRLAATTHQQSDTLS